MGKHAGSLDKKNEILIVLLSISFSFTVLFFTPVELFVRNQKDFVVSSCYIILPMLLATLVIAAGSILLLNLLLKLRETLYLFVSRLMLGLLLAFYVQELFFNGNLPFITGDQTFRPLSLWEKYLNFGVTYIIAMLPLILSFAARQYPDKKFLQTGKGYIIPYLSGIVFVMQACGLVGSVAQYGLDVYERSNVKTLSYEPLVSLSEEKNIIVFLVDRFDSVWLDDLLESYPELYDEFEGFTFYQNNVSHFSSTFPSVPNMLTRVPYNGEEWIDYYNIAWSERTFLDVLKDNGYRVNLALDNASTYATVNDIETKCDNIVPVEADRYRYVYLGKKGVIPTMAALSIGKLTPYPIKTLLLSKYTSDFSNGFLELPPDSNYIPRATGTSTDMRFYNYIVNHNLTADSQKYFSFIHLSGCHDPSAEIANLFEGTVQPGTFSTFNTARGELEILFEFFRQMKAIGIYDCSTIIILGDHGGRSFLIAKELDSENVATLMIKPEYAEAQPLQFDSDSELSNDYLAASVLEYAGLDHSDYGYSYQDIIENDIHEERWFQSMIWRSAGDTSYASLYKITGNARDFENWELVNQPE